MNSLPPSRRRAPPPRRAGRGFTLVEIMVAIAIFSIVVAAIYSTWTLILRASKVGQEAAAQVQRQRIALQTIENSLTCIQSFQASPQYYSFVVQSDDQALLSFTARLPDMFPRNGRFEGFPVRRLTYTVEPPGPGSSELDLVLRQNPILMEMDEDEKNYPLVLARHVKHFVVECLDTNKGEWVTEWNDTNSIPLQVRYSLVLGGNDDFRGAAPVLAATNIVTIPSVMLPALLQNRAGGGPPNRPPGLNPPLRPPGK
jgi:prepilin-type N-terminal cleavage/methylation domain-containing protein